MLFNSFAFLVFFPTVVGIYFLSKRREVRNTILLVASYIFYASWNAAFLSLIIFSTFTDYVVGRLVESSKDGLRKASFLGVSLGLNLGLLFAFKYLGFFTESANSVLDLVGFEFSLPIPHILLPVGISFYTFQTLSYTIDTYLGKRKAEKNFLTFALYVAFFPQLVAGPIERSTHLMPQFNRLQTFDTHRVVSGLRLMLWGLFQKVVVANRLALYVDVTFDSLNIASTGMLLMAALFFAFQIYADFAGYSNRAIGAARVLGFDLMKNFNLPYFADSFADFWRRWHISLSTWFRDYVYIPLGGSRSGEARTRINLFIVFLLSGLWHGAGLTFVVWGATHGVLLVIERILKPLFNIAPKLARQIIVFITVVFVWVLFRADSMPQAMQFFTRLFEATHKGRDIFWPYEFYYGDNEVFNLVLAIVVIFIMEGVSYARIKHGEFWRLKIASLPALWRLILYAFFIIVIVLLGVFSNEQFIYFQF